MTDTMSWFLVIANYQTGVPEITNFGQDGDLASKEYAEAEARHRGADLIEVVLVGAYSEEALRSGYPHYFGVRRTSVEEALRKLEADLHTA